jgi:peptidoglycan/xylan/chitin deacetylase (PgdA/CDA1 family)
VSWRESVKRGLARSGLGRIVRARGVRIFAWHHVLPEAPAWIMRPLIVSPRTFAAQIDHVVRTYAVWGIDDALELLAGLRAPPTSGRDVAVLTFDDGYRSVLDHAAPILAARGLPAIMYVCTEPGALLHDRLHALLMRYTARRMRVTGTALADRYTWPLVRADALLGRGRTVEAADAILEAVDARPVCDALAARLGEPEEDAAGLRLGWDGMIALRARGFTIGAHGASHTLLPRCSDETLRAELALPRAEIAARTGVLPTTVAYPAGRYDARVSRAVAAAGYTAALTTEDRPNRTGADRFRLGRKVLSDAHGPAPDLVAAHLDGLFTTLRLARAVPGDRPLPEVPWS